MLVVGNGLIQSYDIRWIYRAGTWTCCWKEKIGGVEGWVYSGVSFCAPLLTG